MGRMAMRLVQGFCGGGRCLSWFGGIGLWYAQSVEGMMMERRQIVDLWRQGGAAALVTLVRAAGSSYRRPGARLLVAGDGLHAGTISGGCLESEVVRKAAWMVRDGAVVERYSTLFDDTAEVPFGLGCGGVVDLLIEPAGTAECWALMEVMGASLRGEAATVVTLALPMQPMIKD